MSTWPTSRTFSRSPVFKSGEIKRVIIKDMSRFGRDYLQVGMYTEIMFAEYDIHFIAVNDGVDSQKGENDLTPFRNLSHQPPVQLVV